jgi:hypothetical protein
MTLPNYRHHVPEKDLLDRSAPALVKTAPEGGENTFAFSAASGK